MKAKAQVQSTTHKRIVQAGGRLGTKSAGDAGGEGGDGNPAGDEGNSAGDGDGDGSGSAGAKGAQGGDTKGADEGEEKIVSIDDLKGVMADTVKSQLDAHLATVGKSISAEDVAGIVAAELEKHAKSADDSKTMNVKEVGDVVGKCVQSALAGIKTPKAPIHGTGDAKSGGADGADDSIEVPEGFTKGNLPVFAKQLMNAMMNKPQNEGISAGQLAKAKSVGDRIFAKARMSHGVKALTSTGAGTGDEWVPTDLSSELLRRLFIESPLAQMMLGSEIEMPSNPFEFPLSTTRPTFNLESTEGQATDGSTPGTGKLVLDAKKLMAKVEYSYEADEDAIVAILPTVTQLLGEAAADALEGALINGDTAGTHQDSDIEAVAKHASRSFDGFRKLALAIASLKKDLSTGGISRANCLTMIKAMGVYGKRKQDLVWLVSTSGEADFLGLDDVVTVDKRGLAATTLTGQLPSYLGIPIVTSGQVRDDTNAAGVYDGVTTTKGGIGLVNLTRFRLGNRRSFMIETDKDIDTQQVKIVASFRKAFKGIETPSATVQSCVWGYNFNA